MEDSVKQGAGGHDHYLLKLKDIHSHIVAASTEGVPFFNLLFCHWIKKESIFTDSSTLVSQTKLQKIKIPFLHVQCPLQTYSL